MKENAKKLPWLVRIHHRMRTWSFGMVFLAAAMHIADKDYHLATWATLVAILLVYPHVQLWRALRSTHSVESEMRSLTNDSVLLGIFIAIIAFPLWLGFSAAMGTLINNAANKGWRGVLTALLALIVGALIGIAVNGLQLSPHTDWYTTLFCMVGLASYILAIGNLGFVRNIQLRKVREDLRLREKELIEANETLANNLDEIQQLQTKLNDQANHDALTGLYNRRYLDSTLERELERCKRDKLSLTLFMIDIDHFKAINDTYGHQAGDAVLIGIGMILNDFARAGDVACRYGGEEFLLAMPCMAQESGLKRAEELRALVAATPVPWKEAHIAQTVSIGVSVYPHAGSNAYELIKSGDRALYKAKHGGRNRVETEVSTASAETRA